MQAADRRNRAASVLHLPQVQFPGRRPVPCNYGRTRSFACLASCSAAPAYRPARCLRCPALGGGTPHSTRVSRLLSPQCGGHLNSVGWCARCHPGSCFPASYLQGPSTAAPTDAFRQGQWHPESRRRSKRKCCARYSSAFAAVWNGALACLCYPGWAGPWRMRQQDI